MKKMTKTFGVVAASAALALGCAMPAFAADSLTVEVGADNNVTGTDADGASGSTVVNLYGVDSSKQIKAVIPIDMTVSAPKTGGALTCPTPGAYKITNQSSDVDIKLTKAQAKANTDGQWQISTSTLTADSLDTTYKKIQLILAPQTDEFGVSAATLTLTGAEDTLTNFDSHTIAADGGELGIELSGSASPKSGTQFDDSVSEKAAQITYTIAKA